MKIERVLFTIADNGTSGEHLHVELDEELPTNTKLWHVLLLPEPYYVTGIRSTPSRQVTLQHPAEVGRVRLRHAGHYLPGIAPAKDPQS